MERSVAVYLGVQIRGDWRPTCPFSAIPDPYRRNRWRRFENWGVDLGDRSRYPLAARSSDFARADRTIALSRREHEPMVESFFPAHRPLVGYWEVGDVEIESPASAIEKMIELIERLLQEIQAGEPETI